MKLTRAQIATLEALTRSYIKALTRRQRLKLTTLEIRQVLAEARDADILLVALINERERLA